MDNQSWGWFMWIGSLWIPVSPTVWSRPFQLVKLVLRLLEFNTISKSHLLNSNKRRKSLLVFWHERFKNCVQMVRFAPSAHQLKMSGTIFGGHHTGWGSSRSHCRCKAGLGKCLTVEGVFICTMYSKELVSVWWVEKEHKKSYFRGFTHLIAELPSSSLVSLVCHLQVQTSPLGLCAPSLWHPMAENFQARHLCVVSLLVVKTSVLTSILFRHHHFHPCSWGQPWHPLLCCRTNSHWYQNHIFEFTAATNTRHTYV